MIDPEAQHMKIWYFISTWFTWICIAISMFWVSCPSEESNDNWISVVIKLCDCQNRYQMGFDFLLFVCPMIQIIFSIKKNLANILVNYTRYLLAVVLHSLYNLSLSRMVCEEWPLLSVWENLDILLFLNRTWIQNMGFAR